MKNLLTLLVVLASTFTIAQPTVTLVEWNFDDQTFNPNILHPAVAVGPVSTYGINVIGFAGGVNNGTNSADKAPYANGWEGVSNLNPEECYEITIHPDNNKAIKMEHFHMYFRSGSGGGPTTFTLRSNANGDNFTTDIIEVFAPNYGIWTLVSTPLDLPVIEHQESIKFRLYAWGDIGGTWTMDSLRISGHEIYRLEASAILEGPFDNTLNALMNDDLRAAGLLPLQDPYGKGVTTTPDVLAVEGLDAIVDWVWVELRNSVDSTYVVASTAALIQRDGSIVGPKGGSTGVLFDVPITDYYVAIGHRNHLGVMTAEPWPFSPNNMHFSSASVETWGTEARNLLIEGDPGEGLFALWCGDANGDGKIAYSGPDNDRDTVLVGIGGVVPTHVSEAGYYGADCNLDGVMKYTGNGNDRDPILANIGGEVPTSTRFEQIPQSQ